MASLILRNDEIEAAFNIEAADGEELTDNCFVPQVIPDIYKTEYLRKKHHNYIGESDGGHVIFSLQHRPVDGQHKILKTTKKGYEESTLPELTFRNYSVEDLAEHISKDAQNIYYVGDPDFRQEVESVEQKHEQRTDHLKIAVLYCKSGQKTPAEFFSNSEAPEAFHRFLRGMGEQIELLGWNGYSGDMSVKKEGKTYYTKFHDLEVIYHVSCMMSAEGHRRLIGNDVCTIFFRDEGSEPFDVTAVTNLGTMPQIFILVQPKGDKYLISSFSRKTIKPYPPAIPKGHSFSLKEAKEFILTKLHNGFIQATIFCPPINRLWYTPRGAHLDDIATRWPKETSKDKKARTKREKDKYEKLRSEAQSNEKKDLAVVVIAGQNLAVRDTLAKSSDPYVLLTLWDQQVKTKVLKMTLNPVWNEELRLDLRGVDLTDAMLTVTIMDWNLVSSHEFMGEAEISMEDVIHDYLTKTEPVWLKLRARTSEFVSGEISLRFSLDGFLDPSRDPTPDDPEWAKILTGKAPKRGLTDAVMPITGPKIKRTSTPPKMRKSTLGAPTSDKNAIRQSMTVKSANASPSISPRTSIATPPPSRSGSTPNPGLGHSASTEAIPSDKKRSKSPTLADRKRNVIDASGATPRPAKLERSTSDDFNSPTRKRKGSVDRASEASSSSKDSSRSSSPSRSSRPNSPPPEDDAQTTPKTSASSDAIAENPRVKGLASSGRHIKRALSGGLEVKPKPEVVEAAIMPIQRREERAATEAPRLDIQTPQQVCENMVSSIDQLKQNLELLTTHLTVACDNAGDPNMIHAEADKFAHLATATIRLAMSMNQSSQGIIVQQSLPFLVLKKRTVSQHAGVVEQNVIALIRSAKSIINTASTTHAGPPLTPYNTLLADAKLSLSNLSHAVVDLRDHI